MAFSEFETKKYESAVQTFMDRRRPPPHIRAQLDLGYRITGQSVEIYEIRPVWREPTKTIETPVAKTTYVKTQRVWKVYWQRADMKWHLYAPIQEVDTFEAFLEIVNRDEHGCFWG